MNRRVLTVAVAAVGVLAGAATTAATAASTTTAVPASTVSFSPSGCSAQFVRSSSGLINETNRVGCPDWPGVASGTATVAQFRPLNQKTPNPACDANVIVTPFAYTNSDPALNKYFVAGTPYNVCVYLANNQVASGSVDSAAPTGSTATTAAPVAGTYNVCASGTWQNGPWFGVDPEWVQQYGTGADGTDTGTGGDSAGGTLALGWHQSWPGFAPADFGDLQINGQFVDWGAYNAAHTYCVSLPLAQGSTPNLAVFDSGYGDNVGSMAYTITFSHL